MLEKYQAFEKKVIRACKLCNTYPDPEFRRIFVFQYWVE